MSASILTLKHLPLQMEMPPANPALATRVQKIVERAAQATLPLRYLGTMPLFGKQRIYRGENTDWVVTNLANDPLFYDRFGFPIPQENLRELAAIAESGIEFDGLYVAHEVPADTIQDGQRLRLNHVAPSAPPAVAKQSARFGTWGERLWTIAFPFADTGTAVEGAKQIGIALDRLDPVLFGVVIAPRRRFNADETGAWFLLTQWSYAKE